MYSRYPDSEASQEPEMLQSGGSRSSTPGVVDGRAIFSPHSSIAQANFSSYPNVSSPSSLIMSSAQLVALSHNITIPSSKFISHPPEAHRYMSEAYRFATEPVEQSRYSVEHQSYRQVTSEAQRILPYQRLPGSSYRSSHSEVQRIHDDEFSHYDTQRIVSDIQRIQSDPQRLVSESLRAHLNESLLHSSEQSSSAYRPATVESLRSPDPPRTLAEVPNIRTNADAERMVQESLKGYFPISQDETVESPENQSLSESLRYTPTSDSLKYESVRYSDDINISQSMIPENLCITTEAAQNMIPENLRVGTVSSDDLLPENLRIAPEARHHLIPENLTMGSDAGHGVIPENLRIGAETPHLIPENMRVGAETPHSIIAEKLHVSVETSHHLLRENLRIGAETPHSLVPENLRIGTETPHIHPDNLRVVADSMVPENLHATAEPSHLLPENLRITGTPHDLISVPENLHDGHERHHHLIPENIRVGAGTPLHMMPENLRINAETPHPVLPEETYIKTEPTLLSENLRAPTQPSRLVPENLCVTEPSRQVLPENMCINHDSLSITNADGRLLNHHMPESPLSSVRLNYEHHPHRIAAEAVHPVRDLTRVELSRYADSIYRNDLHYSNVVPPTPPTPSPSVPGGLSDSILPSQYFTTTYVNQTYAGCNNITEERNHREILPMELKMERPYQDSNSFDDEYPSPIHLSQECPPPPPIPKPPKTKKLKEPKPPRVPIVHKCGQCERIFKNSTQLKNHMWRHTGEKPFSCSQCGSKFTQQGNLRAHKRIHTGEKPYECNVCHASFTQLSTLKTHLKIHTDERPYKCTQCEAAFRQIANLKTHQVTHTGERPHKCDECDKAFTQKSNLKAHKNRVHSGDAISAPSRRGRKKNPSAIKPFSCNECGAKFTMMSNLKIHMKLHSGENSFECDVCAAGFTQRSNLKSHIQKMHGRNVAHRRHKIKCDECDAVFRLKRCLKSHKKRRHPIKSLKIKLLMESKYLVKSEEDDPEDDFDEDEEEEDDDDDNNKGNELDDSDDMDEQPNFCVTEPIVQIKEAKIEPQDKSSSPVEANLQLPSPPSSQSGSSQWHIAEELIKEEIPDIVSSYPDEMCTPLILESKDVPLESSGTS